MVARLHDANRLFFEAASRPVGPPERHDVHELVVCQSSGYAVEIDGVWHEARPGSVFYHPLGTPHRNRIERGASLLLVQWQETGAGSTRPRRPLDPDGRIGAIAAWLVTDWGEQRARISAFSHHAMQALLALLDAPPPQAETGGSAVRVAIRHMRYHFAEPLDLETLARLVHLSPWHLLRRFKAETGLTPIAFLRQIRLRAAADMLHAGRSLGEITGACGYRDARSLRQALRREFGCAPAELRRSALGHEWPPAEARPG